jgi:hypothetical protein
VKEEENSNLEVRKMRKAKKKIKKVSKAEMKKVKGGEGNTTVSRVAQNIVWNGASLTRNK